MPKNPSVQKQKLKIGFVLDDSLDTADGVQQYVMTLSTWLKNQGHEVHYLVGQTKRTDIPALHSLSRNIKVRFNKNRMTIPLPANKRNLKQLLEDQNFDILHVQLPYSPFLAGRIIALAPKATAVVGTFHVAPHSRIVRMANYFLHVLNLKSIKRFDTIMSVSPVAKEFAKQTIRVDSTVVPNTVDTTPYESAKPFSKYKGTPTVVFLGRLVERKGCQYLLSAIRSIKDKQLVEQPFRVIICGKGPLEQSLKQYVVDHKLKDIVEFVGFVAEEDKPNYLASADIAVFPSTGGESFGIVLIEAMAASPGAVLAGNNPGYASVLHGRTGTLFDPTNTAEFAALLAEYLADPNKRRASHHWQKKEVQKYDVSVVGAGVVGQYFAALHKRRS